MTKSQNIRQKYIKAKKIIERIITVFLTITLIITLIVCLGIVIQVASGKKPSFFGYKFYYVLTDSMKPAYSPGDVLFSKLLEDETSLMAIKQDDVVTFRSKEEAIYGQMVTHRVQKDPYLKDGKYYIETRGDKNILPDAPTGLNSVEAKVVFKLMSLSGVANTLTNFWGMLIIIIFPFLIILSFLIYQLVATFNKKKHVGEENKEIDLDKVDQKTKDKIIASYLEAEMQKQEFEKQVISEFLEQQQNENLTSENAEDESSDKNLDDSTDDKKNDT